MDRELLKYENANGLQKGTINVLSNDLKVLKKSYKETFGVEADSDTLLFGRKIIEVKI